MMKWYQSLFFMILVILNTTAFSQKSCLNTLREAKELYEHGLIDEIPDLLSGCMESGFTRAQRIEAYKLIILTYLFDDDQFAAENTMDAFLKKFPEYEVMPNDPVEFVYLLESYKTSSYYSINISIGPTITSPQITQYHTMLNYERSQLNDRPGGGYYFGFAISRNLWKSINGTVGARITNLSYKFLESNTMLVDDEERTFAEITCEEELQKIDIPVSFTYTLGKGNLHYVGRLGLQTGIVRKAELSLRRDHYETRETIFESGLDVKDQRRSFDYALITGIGVEYKVPRGYLVLDIRYHMSFAGINLPEERYVNPSLNSRYLYADDDFRLHVVTMGIAYHFSIYQSKKNRF